MSSFLTSALAALALCLVVGFASLAEFALTFVSRRRLRDRAYHGDRGARAALRLGRDPDGFVVATRLVVMLAIILAGVWCGESIASRTRTGASGGADRDEAVATVAAVAGLAIAALLFGDLLPRSLARSRPETFASLLGRSMWGASRLVSPLAGGYRRLGRLLTRWLGGRGAASPPTTEQRIKELMFEGVESGDLDESKHMILNRAIRFCDRRARALMTPRDEVVWLDVRDQPDEIHAKIASSMNTSFPVCDGTLDNLLGMVDLKELLARGAESRRFRFKGLLTLPAFIYEGARGPRILEVLKKSAARSAVVLDEFGSVVGLLTLTDVQEAILGAMSENSAEDQPMAVKRPDGSWLLDGRMPIDEFFDLLRVDEPPDGEFDTLGGLVVTKLGHIPRVGESIERLGLRFEVVDMDSNRVHRVVVHPPGRRGRS